MNDAAALTCIVSKLGNANCNNSNSSVKFTETGELQADCCVYMLHQEKQQEKHS